MKKFRTHIKSYWISMHTSTLIVWTAVVKADRRLLDRLVRTSSIESQIRGGSAEMDVTRSWNRHRRRSNLALNRRRMSIGERGTLRRWQPVVDDAPPTRIHKNGGVPAGRAPHRPHRYDETRAAGRTPDPAAGAAGRLPAVATSSRCHCPLQRR
jgi:hypothetical protein